MNFKNLSKFFLSVSFVIFCFILVACNSSDKKANEDTQKQVQEEKTGEDKKKPSDGLIKDIISDFDIRGLDGYVVDETETGYLIHKEAIELELDKNHRVMNFDGTYNLNKNIASKYNSLDEVIKMLFDKGYVSGDYEFNRKYPIMDAGYSVFLAKKYPNGIFNPYDCIKFSFETQTNRLMSFNRIEEYVAEDNPKLSREEASHIAVEALQDMLKLSEKPEINDVDYCVIQSTGKLVKGSKLKKFLEVYEVSFKQGSVYVDAETKDVVSIDLVKSEP